MVLRGMLITVMMVVMLVIVIIMITVVMVVMAVGAVLRLERGILLRHGSPEPPDHVVKHMIMLVAEIARGDLKRHVAVPEVIGKAGEPERGV